MSDASRDPYRTGAEPEAQTPPPPSFEREWTDARAAGSSWAIYQLLFVGLVVALMLGSAWWPIGAAGLVTVVGYLYHRRREQRPVALRAEVREGALTVRFHDKTMLVAPLSTVLDIVVDRSEIQRVTYHQGVGEPLPNTQVSGGVQVGRLAARMADDREVRLTETAANDSTCMETFGKLRVFLRAHGWKPADER